MFFSFIFFEVNGRNTIDLHTQIFSNVAQSGRNRIMFSLEKIVIYSFTFEVNDGILLAA